MSTNLDRDENEAGVPSPCISVCNMDASTGWCQGCLRTLDEIAGWSSFDGATRRAVWEAIEQRHVQYMANRSKVQR
ncbi:MAG TPA: DUF1289 domain-containing protein [Paraburkholderia sp.]|jgi:hypothetical protein|nr:DUF1289 domain-containing protein [Paraburkholderia sp.]